MRSLSESSPVEELAAFLAQRPSAQDVAAFHLSDAALARVNELMDKNKDGALTAEEDRELDRLILLDDVIGLIQSHLPTDDGATAATPDTPEA